MFKNEMCPPFYRRYVDDTFCLFTNNSHIERFHTYINSMHDSIKFDKELEHDGKLDFLDTVVSKGVSLNLI